MSTVTFLSAQDAGALVEPGHIISLGSPGDEVRFGCQHKSVLTLEFDDVEGFVGSDGLRPFTLAQAEEIIGFIKGRMGQPLVVHCFAGVSRSAAVARFVSDVFPYRLDLSEPCLGTTRYANKHVYDTLHAAHDGGTQLVAYLADLELAERLRGSL